jgi:hypothetical protein
VRYLSPIDIKPTPFLCSFMASLLIRGPRSSHPLWFCQPNRSFQRVWNRYPRYVSYVVFSLVLTLHPAEIGMVGGQLLQHPCRIEDCYWLVSRQARTVHRSNEPCYWSIFAAQVRVQQTQHSRSQLGEGFAMEFLSISQSSGTSASCPVTPARLT